MSGKSMTQHASGGMVRRRSRTLSRKTVVDAAVIMVDRDGPDAVSMRALAAELGVTPMALYNHVADKRDLLAAVAERILAETTFEHDHGDWRERIEACFRSLRAMCLRHPGAARLMQIEGVAPPAALAPMEVTLDALKGAGLGPADALRAYFALIGFTLSQASYQTQGPFPGLEPDRAVRKGQTSGALEWDFDRAFEFGLALILDGIERVAVKSAQFP